jgi:hypothetical protein
MKFLRASLAVLVLCCAAARAEAPAPLPPSKEMYSFADLYRVTLGEPVLPAAGVPGSTFQVRAVAEVPLVASASPYVFSIAAVAPARGGLLLLAGLAAALWVARRRLGYAIRT